MNVVKHVANLNCPFHNRRFIDLSAAKSHLLGEVTAPDPTHHKVIPAGLDEVIEYSRNRRMIELSEHLGFAFEVLDRFSALTLVGEHLDHLFDRTEPVCKPLVA